MIEMILNAGHGEYAPSPSDRLAVGVVASPAREDYAEDDFEVVIALRGMPQALRAAWLELAADVAQVPSGDDTVYDYWPSGVRLLFAFSDQLDRITSWSQFRSLADLIVSDVLSVLNLDLEDVGL